VVLLLLSEVSPSFPVSASNALSLAARGLLQTPRLLVSRVDALYGNKHSPQLLFTGSIFSSTSTTCEILDQHNHYLPEAPPVN